MGREVSGGKFFRGNFILETLPEFLYDSLQLTMILIPFLFRSSVRTDRKLSSYRCHRVLFPVKLLL